MCDVHAFVVGPEGEEKVMESVEQVEATPEEIVLKNIFGEEKRLAARFKLLDTSKSRLLLEPL
jgi:predicted RNA-binding protein